MAGVALHERECALGRNLHERDPGVHRGGAQGLGRPGRAREDAIRFKDANADQRILLATVFCRSDAPEDPIFHAVAVAKAGERDELAQRLEAVLRSFTIKGAAAATRPGDATGPGGDPATAFPAPSSGPGFFATVQALGLTVLVMAAWIVALVLLFVPESGQVPLLLKIFAAGLVPGFVVSWFSGVVSGWLHSRLAPSGGPPTFLSKIVTCPVTACLFLALALLWMSTELLVLWLVTRPSPPIKRPRDGSLLAAVAAAGVGGYLLFLQLKYQGLWGVATGGVLVLGSSILCSAVWGYYLGLSLHRGAPPLAPVAEGMVIAVAIQGFLSTGQWLFHSLVFLPVQVAVLAGLGWLFKKRLFAETHVPWLATLPAEPAPAPTPTPPTQ
ncbi:MAG: hypothetical protein HY815_21350 [Candidatus Riflebacteria bacterium]|nr:hypothetical protein [Candidatus Riflebacteria bacterium]